MSGPAPTLVASWRAWHGTQHIVLVATGLLVLYLWSGPIEVPGREDVAQVIGPLTPTFLAFACLSGSRTAHHDPERLTPRGATWLRLGYLAVVLVLILASSAIGGSTGRAVLVRNGALLCGLALLAVELLPAAIAWTPLALVPMLTWLLGSNGLGVPPETWAVLLQPAGSTPARDAALLIATAGAAAYLVPPMATELRRARRRHALSDARSGR